MYPLKYQVGAINVNPWSCGIVTSRRLYNFTYLLKNGSDITVVIILKKINSVRLTNFPAPGSRGDRVQ